MVSSGFRVDPWGAWGCGVGGILSALSDEVFEVWDGAAGRGGGKHNFSRR